MIHGDIVQLWTCKCTVTPRFNFTSVACHFGVTTNIHGRNEAKIKSFSQNRACVRANGISDNLQ